MFAPFVACMVLVAIHSYLGLHVIAREVIFVDLSLAQMAGLGSVVALLYGVAPDSRTAFISSLVFTCIGAALFALTRTRGKGRVPHEAIIGIVYVAASAASILVADRAPRGAEALHDVLEGSIIWITWPTILKKGAAYLGLGILHFALRRQFLKISFHPDEAEREGWHIRVWDFLFYVSFGVAVTMSVPVAGVLLVFTMLVVPAVVAFLFSRDIWREFQEAGLACAPLRRPEENIGDPHFGARQTFLDVDHPELGRRLTEVGAKWLCPTVPWRTGPPHGIDVRRWTRQRL